MARRTTEAEQKTVLRAARKCERGGRPIMAAIFYRLHAIEKSRHWLANQAAQQSDGAHPNSYQRVLYSYERQIPNVGTIVPILKVLDLAVVPRSNARGFLAKLEAAPKPKAKPRARRRAGAAAK